MRDLRTFDDLICGLVVHEPTGAETSIGTAEHEYSIALAHLTALSAAGSVRAYHRRRQHGHADPRLQVRKVAFFPSLQHASPALGPHQRNPRTLL